MKMLACCLALVLTTVSFAKAETVTYTKVKSGGNMEWVGGTVICWTNVLLTCQRDPPPPGSFSITTYGTGYLLTTSVSNMQAWPVADPSDIHTISSANHTFDSSIEMRIATCSAYPALVGRTVNLGNLSTNSSGTLTVYIP